jgi:hypothetical protein
VSRRTDDDYVIDGQRRLGGARIAGVDALRANVHHDLTPEQEAELWRGLNTSAALTPAQTHKAGLFEGRPESIAIQRIVDELHLPKFSTWSAAYNAVERYGAPVLSDALALAVQTWPGERDAYGYSFVVALVRILATNPTIDLERAHRRWRTTPAWQWLNQARDKTAATGSGGIAGALERLLKAQYNGRLKRGRLG